MDVAILSSLSSQALLYPSTLLLFKCSDHWPIPLSIYTCCSLLHALILQPNLALKGSCLKASSIFCHVLTNNSPCPSPCSCYCQGLSWYNCQIYRHLPEGCVRALCHPLPSSWASLHPWWPFYQDHLFLHFMSKSYFLNVVKLFLHCTILPLFLPGVPDFSPNVSLL